MRTLDCRGHACPLPVLMTKEMLETLGDDDALVLVDSEAAKENVERFAEGQGYAVVITRTGQALWELALTRIGGEPASMGPGYTDAAWEEIGGAILILSDRIGSNSELGAILMRAFFATLPKADTLPEKIILLNSGVRLAIEGSQVLEEMGQLSAKGVQILACGTCLDFFGAKDKLKAGRVTNMLDTVETLTKGMRVVTIS